MKLFQTFNVTPLMESNQPLTRDVLHEDLQILRHTLAAISDDVRRFSRFSADAVERAIQNLDQARDELVGEEENFPAAEQITGARIARSALSKKQTTEDFSSASYHR